MLNNTFLVWALAFLLLAFFGFSINKIYNRRSQYDITFTISPDLYDVLDSLAGKDESVEEYIGRLCQEIAETEWYVNQAQSKQREKN